MKYPGPGERGHWWAGIVSTEKVYSFDPIGFAELNDEERTRILGAQACLWTEFVEGPERADYQTYPRLCALAEVVWSPQGSRAWDLFRERLGPQLLRLDAQGVAFRIPPPAGWAENGVITVIPPFGGARVRYTLDGTEPDRRSTLYTGPFETDDPDQVYLRTFLGGRASKTVKGAQRKPFAEWTPKQMSTEFKPVRFDATEAISRAGNWKLVFRYIRGGQKIVIRSVRLMENDEEIARDEHEGHAGSRHTHNRYSLPVRTYRPEAVYTVIAELRSDGGTDSRGHLILERSPNLEPEGHIETTIPHYSNHKPDTLLDGNPDTFFWSSRPVKQGETITWRFEEPVTVTLLESTTGKLEDPTADILTDAVLEISEDGHSFRNVAGFEYGTARARMEATPIRAARIRVTSDHDLNWLVVRDLVLRAE
jgi:hexosaminidase